MADETKQYDVIIIGAGVAGMTAAIYARRANKTVLILEAKTYGGQIINTFNIANWPGDPGISGVDLVTKIYHQVNNLGVDFEFDEVVKVRDLGKYKEVQTEDAVYRARALIVAVGSKDRKLGLPREDKLTGRGVSYCATCDGGFYKGKDVAVIGGGNTALYDALYLSDIANKVYLVHRRAEFRGDAVMVERLKAKSNVEFVLESQPVELVGEKKIEGVRVENLQGEKRMLDVAGVFVAVGRVPETRVFSEIVDLDTSGYVVAGEDCVTSCAGVFVAGDCRTKEVRQLVTAAGDGAVSADAVVKYLG